MCDYSLHHVATRPAQIQDKLVTTKFKNSITRGFAAVGEPHVAVCLMPGTEIAFDENVECENRKFRKSGSACGEARGGRGLGQVSEAGRGAVKTGPPGCCHPSGPNLVAQECKLAG